MYHLLLRPGDDISYRIGQQPSDYGRIIQINGGAGGMSMIVQKYVPRDSLDSEGDDEDDNLPTVFLNLTELKMTDEQEEIQEDQFTGLIFVLSYESILSNSFNIEGMVNAFYIKDPTYQSLEKSVHTFPLTMIHSIRSIQQSQQSILNRRKIGQVLNGSRKIELLPIAWQYLKQVLPILEVNIRTGVRTEKVILPQLMKASIKHKVIIEKMTVSTPEHIEIFKRIVGRFAIVGTRSPFPRSGSRPEPVRFGTIKNTANIITLQYISKYSRLEIKCCYQSAAASNSGR
jgi:hypothetical protein